MRCVAAYLGLKQYNVRYERLRELPKHRIEAQTETCAAFSLMHINKLQGIFAGEHHACQMSPCFPFFLRAFLSSQEFLYRLVGRKCIDLQGVAGLLFFVELQASLKQKPRARA